jgi:hypothetical protein
LLEDGHNYERDSDAGAVLLLLSFDALRHACSDGVKFASQRWFDVL